MCYILHTFLLFIKMQNKKEMKKSPKEKGCEKIEHVFPVKGNIKSQINVT